MKENDEMSDNEGWIARVIEYDQISVRWWVPKGAWVCVF